MLSEALNITQYIEPFWNEDKRDYLLIWYTVCSTDSLVLPLSFVKWDEQMKTSACQFFLPFFTPYKLLKFCFVFFVCL